MHPFLTANSADTRGVDYLFLRPSSTAQSELPGIAMKLHAMHRRRPRTAQPTKVLQASLRFAHHLTEWGLSSRRLYPAGWCSQRLWAA
jgi:hypothetical protein